MHPCADRVRADRRTTPHTYQLQVSFLKAPHDRRIEAAQPQTSCRMAVAPVDTHFGGVGHRNSPLRFIRSSLWMCPVFKQARRIDRALNGGPEQLVAVRRLCEIYHVIDSSWQTDANGARAEVCD